MAAEIDPLPVLEELAAAATDVAAVLKFFPTPGSAPSSATARVMKRFTAALTANAAAIPEINRRLIGRWPS
jgi:hypothetical protein